MYIYLDRTKHILHQIEWHRIILDESHSIKNATTSTGRSIAKLRAKNRWCLTGTPFGKHIHDIGNQLKFIGMDDSHLSKLSLKSITKQALFNGRASLASFQSNACRPLIHVISKVIMRHKKAQKFNDEPLAFCLGISSEELNNNSFEYRTLSPNKTLITQLAQAQEFNTKENVGVFVLTV